MPLQPRSGFLALISRWTLWTAVVVVAVLLGACGGGDDDDDDPTPTATQGATVAAPTTSSGGADTTNTSPTAEATFDFAAMEETANAQSTKVAEFKGEIDACDLVSRKDAEEIMGVKLSGDPFPGVPGFTDAQSFCNYNPEAVPGTAVVPGETIQLIALKEEDIKALGMGEDIDTFWDEGKADSQDDEGFVEIDDIGDEAHYTSESGMVARKGDTLIGVSGLDQEKSTKFLKKAIDNL